MDSSATKPSLNIEVDKDRGIGFVEGEEETPDSNQGKRKDAEDASVAATKKAKVKRVIPTRSDAWDHFTRTKDDRDKCICHYCQKVLSCNTKSGTSNLRGHLLICKEYKAWLDGEKNKQKGITPEGNLKSAKVPEPVFREACNELLVTAELPLSFIDCVPWKNFCNKVNLYKPHSRRTACRGIVAMYLSKKAAMKQWFYINQTRVSLTTDIWTAQVTCHSYMAITAHFVDSDWQLRKLIIGFKVVMDHKGQTISTTLLDCLAEWSLEKVFCITVDNATSNTNALSSFTHEFRLLAPDSLIMDGTYMHMRCSAHIINLIAREGLTELGQKVSSVRNAVQYVRASTNRLNAFDLKVTNGKVTRGALPMDVCTRWNSTFLMLSRALKFRLGFDRMEAEDKLYNDYFLEIDSQTKVKRCGPPTKQDWCEVQNLARFLLMFYNSTLVVSSSTKVNSYKCYGEIVTIERNLTALASSKDLDLQKKAKDMLAKFVKYWDGMKNVNKLLIIATVLDPRKKLSFAKLCFEKLYGNGTVECLNMEDSVGGLLGSIFLEYNNRCNKPVAGAGQSSQSQSHSQSYPTSSGPENQEHIDKMDLGLEAFDYENMDCVYKDLVAETGEDTRSELEVYLTEPVEKPKTLKGFEFDVLSWWKGNKMKFPVLAEMAKDFMAMQVSSVASESAFSTCGRILEPHRSCLTHFTIEVLMCTEQWLHADLKIMDKVPTHEEILAETEMLDNIDREFQTPI